VTNMNWQPREVSTIVQTIKVGDSELKLYIELAAPIHLEYEPSVTQVYSGAKPSVAVGLTEVEFN
jgi:hypothetical protein